MQRAWLMEALAREDVLSLFGLESNDLATILLSHLKSRPAGEHGQRNRWIAQHPLANLPVIGWMFKVREFPQYGKRGTLAAERGGNGPSVRMVWDLRDPYQSRWILPVGQSGHVLNEHYDSMQLRWFSGKSIKVFAENEREEFKIPPM